MKRIGFQLNCEVCDENGNESIADIFIEEDGEDTTVYIFEPGTDQWHPGSFLDEEEQSWLDNIEAHDIIDNETIKAGTPTDQIFLAVINMLQGGNPPPIPQAYYSENEETSAERMRLDTMAFQAVCSEHLRALNIIN